MSLLPYPKFVGDASPELDRAVARIAKAVLERKADFLFGAGMSVPPPSSVPAGRQLACKLLELFFPDVSESMRNQRISELASNVPFECIVQAIEASPGRKRDDLTATLKEILTEPTFDINQGHKNFMSVAYWGGRARVKRIFTTNFDTLLEQALGKRAVRVTEKNAADLDDIHARKEIPILHLHGVLDERYEITETDVFSTPFRFLSAAFQAAIRDADAFVFVGYSMSDPDFRSIYLRHHEQIELRHESKKEAYVVGPAEDGYAYDLGKAIWSARRAIWIPVDAECLFAGIRNYLEQKGQQDIRKAIMKKYDITDEKALDDKITQTASILEIDETDAIDLLAETWPKSGPRK